MFRVASRRLAQLDYAGGCFGKGGNGGRGVASNILGMPFFGQRVSPFGDRRAVGGFQRTRLGQAHGRVGSQTDVPAIPIDDNSLDPGLGAGGSNVEVEPVAFTVAPRFADVLHRECGKLSHSPVSPHSEWDIVALFGEWWDKLRRMYH